MAHGPTVRCTYLQYVVAECKAHELLITILAGVKQPLRQLDAGLGETPTQQQQPVWWGGGAGLINGHDSVSEENVEGCHSVGCRGKSGHACPRCTQVKRHPYMHLHGPYVHWQT